MPTTIAKPKVATPLNQEGEIGLILAYTEMEYLYQDPYMLSKDKTLGPALHGLIDNTRRVLGIKPGQEGKPEPCGMPDWHVAWEMVAKYFYTLPPRLHRNIVLTMIHEALAPGTGALTEHGVLGCTTCAAQRSKPEIAFICEAIARGALDVNAAETYMQEQPPYVCFTFTGNPERLAQLQSVIPPSLTIEGHDQRIEQSLVVTGAVTRDVGKAAEWAKGVAAKCGVVISSFYGYYTPLTP